MSTWKTKVLADLVYFNPESIGKKYNYKQIHYLDISSVGTGVADFKNVIDINVAPSRAKRIVKPNDTIIATVRPVNRSFYYLNNFPENTIVSTGFAVLRPKADLINSRFLFYVISNETFTSFLVANEQGSNYPAVTPEIIGRAEIILPPLKTQKRIASILSVYDDLIENNSKRIKLLEEIAQRTYEEWFMKFRVNGEQLSIDEATGLPNGWKYKPFHDLIDFKEGPGLRNTQYRDSGIPFLNIRVIKDDEVDLSKVQFLDPIEVENKYQHFLLNENDHVISTSGTLGRVVTIRKRHLPICLNTSLIRMRPLDNNFGKWLIKHTITNPKFKETMDSYANGSAQLNFGPIHLKQIKLIAPSQTIALQYEKIAEPIEELIKKLKDQNIFLKESRDILLPRLMSGTINVES
jgi:type I restriction enzyme S subunit